MRNDLKTLKEQYNCTLSLRLALNYLNASNDPGRCLREAPPSFTQGCARIYSALYRLEGSTLSNPLIKSFAWLEIGSHCGEGNSNCPFLIISNSFSFVSSKKGGNPHNLFTKTTLRRRGRKREALTKRKGWLRCSSNQRKTCTLNQSEFQVQYTKVCHKQSSSTHLISL